MHFAIDGTITKIILEIMIITSHASRDLYKHYSSVGLSGFLKHVTIILIDKSDPSDTTKGEGYLRRTLCTMTSYSLNIGDHV